jgi:hypothetical protein
MEQLINKYITLYQLEPPIYVGVQSTTPTKLPISGGIEGIDSEVRTVARRVAAELYPEDYQKRLAVEKQYTDDWLGQSTYNMVTGGNMLYENILGDEALDVDMVRSQEILDRYILATRPGKTYEGDYHIEAVRASESTGMVRGPKETEDMAVSSAFESEVPYRDKRGKLRWNKSSFSYRIVIKKQGQKDTIETYKDLREALTDKRIPLDIRQDLATKLRGMGPVEGALLPEPKVDFPRSKVQLPMVTGWSGTRSEGLVEGSLSLTDFLQASPDFYLYGIKPKDMLKILADPSLTDLQREGIEKLIATRAQRDIESKLLAADKANDTATISDTLSTLTDGELAGLLDNPEFALMKNHIIGEQQIRDIEARNAGKKKVHYTTSDGSKLTVTLSGRQARAMLNGVLYIDDPVHASFIGAVYRTFILPERDIPDSFLASMEGDLPPPDVDWEALGKAPEPVPEPTIEDLMFGEEEDIMDSWRIGAENMGLTRDPTEGFSRVFARDIEETRLSQEARRFFNFMDSFDSDGNPRFPWLHPELRSKEPTLYVPFLRHIEEEMATVLKSEPGEVAKQLAFWLGLNHSIQIPTDPVGRQAYLAIQGFVRLIGVSDMYVKSTATRLAALPGRIVTDDAGMVEVSILKDGVAPRDKKDNLVTQKVTVQDVMHYPERYAINGTPIEGSPVKDWINRVQRAFDEKEAMELALLPGEHTSRWVVIKGKKLAQVPIMESTPVEHGPMGNVVTKAVAKVGVKVDDEVRILSPVEALERSMTTAYRRVISHQMLQVLGKAAVDVDKVFPVEAAAVSKAKDRVTRLQSQVTEADILKSDIQKIEDNTSWPVKQEGIDDTLFFLKAKLANLPKNEALEAALKELKDAEADLNKKVNNSLEEGTYQKLVMIGPFEKTPMWFSKDVAKKIMTAVEPMTEQNPTRLDSVMSYGADTIVDLGSLIRTSTTGFDVGTPFIHALPMLAHSLFGGDLRWAKTLVGSWATFFHTKNVAKLMESDLEAMNFLMAHGVLGGGADYTQAIERFGMTEEVRKSILRDLSLRVPDIFGIPPRLAARLSKQMMARFGTSFEYVLMKTAIDFYHMTREVLPDGTVVRPMKHKDDDAVADYIRKWIFQVDPHRLSVGKTQRGLETFAGALAPRMLRSWASIGYEALQPNRSPEAWAHRRGLLKLIIAMMTLTTGMTIISDTIKGETPSTIIEHLVRRLVPGKGSSKEFWGWNDNDSWYGMGSTLRSALVMLGSMASGALPGGQPASAIYKAPFNFWQTRAAVGMHAILNGADYWLDTNRYLEPDSPIESLWFMVRSWGPFSAVNMATSEALIPGLKTTAAGFIGLRGSEFTTPETTSALVMEDIKNGKIKQTTWTDSIGGIHKVKSRNDLNPQEKADFDARHPKNYEKIQEEKRGVFKDMQDLQFEFYGDPQADDKEKKLGSLGRLDAALESKELRPKEWRLIRSDQKTKLSEDTDRIRDKNPDAFDVETDPKKKSLLDRLNEEYHAEIEKQTNKNTGQINWRDVDLWLVTKTPDEKELLRQQKLVKDTPKGQEYQKDMLYLAPYFSGYDKEWLTQRDVTYNLQLRIRETGGVPTILDTMKLDPRSYDYFEDFSDAIYKYYRASMSESEASRRQGLLVDPIATAVSNRVKMDLRSGTELEKTVSLLDKWGYYVTVAFHRYIVEGKY